MKNDNSENYNYGWAGMRDMFSVCVDMDLDSTKFGHCNYNYSQVIIAEILYSHLLNKIPVNSRRLKAF